MLPSHCILKIKHKIDGAPTRYKGRLVVDRNHQEDPADYVEMYAPVASIDLVRLVLAYSVSNGGNVEHVDVKSAFLNAPLPSEYRYIIRFPSIKGSRHLNGQLVRLCKSRYGLRQAPKLWYQELKNILRHHGFEQSAQSDCLFVLKGSKHVFIVAYVDDLLDISERL